MFLLFEQLHFLKFYFLYSLITRRVMRFKNENVFLLILIIMAFSWPWPTRSDAVVNNKGIGIIEAGVRQV